MIDGFEASSWIGKDFLAEYEHSAEDLRVLIELAAQLKSQRRNGTESQALSGRQIALVLAKTSTRTRLAFEVAIREQGGAFTVLDPSTSQIGHKESVADTARLLDRLFDAIAFRGASHDDVVMLAHHAQAPVYNALTDDWHPTQMLADFLTMSEHAPRGATVPCYAFVGDGRSNMGNSLLVTGALLGADVRIVAPAALQPTADVQDLAHRLATTSGARVHVTDDVAVGVHGVDFLHTDVWVSMGEAPELWPARVDLLRPYRVDRTMLEATGNPAVKFMHCLPAYHDQQTSIGRMIADRFGLDDGVEVTDEVFESPASIVFDQAENRMHTIKALLVATLSSDT